MMGATASRNPCTCSHSGLKLSLPSKRSSTVTTVPGCVCRKGTMLQPGMDYEAPSHHPRSAPTCLLCPARTRDLVPHPTLPTPAPARKEVNWPRGAAFSSAFSLPSHCWRLQLPTTRCLLPDLVDVFQQVAEAVRAVKEPVHHDDRLVGSAMERGGCMRQQQQQEGQQEQDPSRGEPWPPEP